MIFVFGLDEGFVLPTGIAVRSLGRFLARDDQIVLLHDRVSAGSLAKIAECAPDAQVRDIACERLLQKVWKPTSYLTRAAFLRFLAPQVLEDESRCVYADGDVVFRRDPRQLAQTDLDGMTLGAVRSRVAPFLASPGAIAPWLEMGLPSAAPYFNSGVLVMDLDRWRALDITGRITEIMSEFGGQLHIADQDALNAAVVGDWMQLDRTWNYLCHVTESFLQQPELEPVDPAIAHFAGRAKPWHWGTQPLFAEEWHELLADSPWSDYRPEAPTRWGQARGRARRAVGRATASVSGILKPGR